MIDLPSLLRLYRAHGWRRVWMHVSDVVWFDLRHRVDTGTWLPLSGYSMDTAGMKHYQASFTSELARVFAIARNVCDASRSSFFDMGAGKGKALILAAQHLKPQKLIGVELHPELAATARRNLQKLHIPAEIIEGPVQDFTAYAPNSILYLCDPFEESILQCMIENLQQRAKHAILIYNNPVYDVTRYGFELRAQTDGWHANNRTHIYQWSAA